MCIAAEHSRLKTNSVVGIALIVGQDEHTYMFNNMLFDPWCTIALEKRRLDRDDHPMYYSRLILLGLKEGMITETGIHVTSHGGHHMKKKAMCGV